MLAQATGHSPDGSQSWHEGDGDATLEGRGRRRLLQGKAFASLVSVQTREQRAALIAAQRRLVGEPERDWPEPWRPFGVVAR